MKKNLLYLSILLLLIIISYFIVFKNEDKSFNKHEANFTIKDTSNIKSIFLTSMHNENVKLDKTANGWMLNDTLLPRNEAVLALLTVLNQQKPEQPVSLSYHDQIVKDLSANNTKIEVYNLKGKKTHSFYVGKNPGPNNETYMLSEKAKRPYIVKLPFQNNFVGIRYFSKISEWKSNQILFNAAPIEFINIEYKDSNQYSYQLKVVDTNIYVTGNIDMQKSLNTKRAKEYITFFEKVFCLGYEDNYVNKNNIIQDGRQLGTLKIKRKNHAIQTITIYFKPPSQDTKSFINIGNDKYDIDFYFGLLNQNDFILMSSQMVQKIFRYFHEFYELEKLP